MATVVCKHNQNGYCKFGNHCRNRHVKEICNTPECHEEMCELRHPRSCKFQRLYGNCKFGSSCAFLHSSTEEQLKIEVLEEKVKGNEEKMEKLECLVQELKVRIESCDYKEVSAGNLAVPVQDIPIQSNENLTCDLCDFVSFSENGLVIHMGHKHKNIEQLDGFSEFENEEDDDQLLLSTERYWRTGILGSTFQTYLDVLIMIDGSTLEEDDKNIEKELVLKARKEAFGDDFMYYPPWRKF